MIDIQRAEELYQHIKNKLKGSEGKIVAIDVESGDYFIGSDTIEAYELGRKKYPSKGFFFKRIGTRYTYVVA